MTIDQNTIVTIVAGVGLVALAVILLRFGRQIARTLLVVGALAVLGTFALAMLRQATATQAAATAATVASAGQTVNSFLLGLLVALILGGIGVAAYFYIRFKLSGQSPRSWSPRQVEQPRRLPLPSWREQQQIVPPVIYYVDEDGQEIDMPVIPSEWGW